MSKILVVEDEPMVAEVVERYLRRDGHEVTTVFDGSSAIEQFARTTAELVILDLMLPRLNGLEVCRALRRNSDVAIIMLTAKGDERDRLEGLNLGADDYITKPFSPRELTARVRAVLRRTKRAGDEPRIINCNGLMIDGNRREAIVNGQVVGLTTREFDILYHLASHPSQVFTRERLVASLWDDAFDGDASTVTVHVRRLREKIETDPARPRYVKTVWGSGYRFDP